MKNQKLILGVIFVVVIVGIIYLLRSGSVSQFETKYSDVDFSLCENVSRGELLNCATNSIILKAKEDNKPELCSDLPVPERQARCIQRVNDYQNLLSGQSAFCAGADDSVFCEDLTELLMARETFSVTSCNQIQDPELNRYCLDRILEATTPNIDVDEPPQPPEPENFNSSCGDDQQCLLDLANLRNAVNNNDIGLCPAGEGFLASSCLLEVPLYHAYSNDDVALCSSNSECVTHYFVALSLDNDDDSFCELALANGGNSAQCRNIFTSSEGYRFAYLEE